MTSYSIYIFILLVKLAIFICLSGICNFYSMRIQFDVGSPLFSLLCKHQQHYIFFLNMCCKIVFQSIVFLLILWAILLLEGVIYRGCDPQLTPELEPGKWQLEAHHLLPISRILAAGGTQDMLHLSVPLLIQTAIYQSGLSLPALPLQERVSDFTLEAFQCVYQNLFRTNGSHTCLQLFLHLGWNFIFLWIILSGSCLCQSPTSFQSFLYNFNFFSDIPLVISIFSFYLHILRSLNNSVFYLFCLYVLCVVLFIFLNNMDEGYLQRFNLRSLPLCKEKLPLCVLKQTVIKH